jgi:nucleotide-binding universal stress UspA family protein
MKRILVPVDFSECSIAAATAAITIASKGKAELVFLHIYPADKSRPILGNRSIALRGERNAIIGNIRLGLGKLVALAGRAGVKAKQELVFSNAQEWIHDYIKPYRIDFVVMGSHGSGISKKPIVGSTALHVIRRANVPVLVIKKKTQKLSVRDIVFASDFKNDFIKAFQPVVELAAILGARIHLLYICTPYHFMATRSILASMKRFMHQFRRVPYTAHVYNAVTEEIGIHDYAEASDAGIIAITTRGRTGLAKMLAPSIAERVIKRENTPLLVVNIKSGGK